MSDIIHLLPDHIANQIAAGEVIQRPASAVKELLENAVDSGADEVRLIIKDAGKTLVQVIDNGKGMSETDARMAFERHATSKISTIEDLFRIRTMGFRGEALASIAAVAQVELKTKRREDEAGTLIELENSRVTRQEPVAVADGSSIAMKNLFFNVPARRNFLKSNASELRHIVDEFIRVTMANPGVFFSFTSNGEEMFHLEKGTLKQRIVQVFGNSYASKLVSVQENTDYLNIYGFAGKPETAKKTRGDQYFFVNGRFIKSPYLHHAVMNAYERLIPSDSFPMYALFIDLDPVRLDINVHPTKQEIKFEDEKLVYAFVQAAVKHALAQFSISPTLDFDLDPNIQQLESVTKPVTGDTISSVRSSPLFQGFTRPHQAHLVDSGNELRHWKDFFEAPPADAAQPSGSSRPMFEASPATMDIDLSTVTQLADAYIMVPLQTGFLLVHQQNAHERIIYESYSAAAAGKQIASQRLLFPVTFELSASDAVLFAELMPELKPLGFELESFGKNTFIIHGAPAGLPEGNEKSILENMLEQFKHYSHELKTSAGEKIWRSLASQQSVKAGKKLQSDELQEIIKGLQVLGFPSSTATGRPVYIRYDRKELDRLFGR